MTAQGGVFLQGVEARGEVRLLGATIGGNLECDGSKFLGGNLPRQANNPSSTTPVTRALDADNIRVSGYVFLRNGFEARGEVSLLEARIGASLNCVNAKFLNPNKDALNAGGIHVSGSVYLHNSEFVGETFFLGGTIDGSLECDGATFNNPTGTALDAEAILVRNSIFFRRSEDDQGNTHPFKVSGAISLIGAKINGTLQLTGIVTESMILDLDSCHVETLLDDKTSWPTNGRTFINGFTYRRFDQGAFQDVEGRKAWLRLYTQRRYSPQPYEQLAKVLRESGHERDAKEILIAKERDRGSWGRMNWWSRFWHEVSGGIIVYGYGPLRALWWMALIISLGTLFFDLGHREYISQVALSTPTQPTPPFNALMYSLDTFLPIIDFHQEADWFPYQHVPVPISLLSNTTSTNTNEIFWAIVWDWIISRPYLHYYLWFHIAAGWFLTSFFVAGLTGLIRR